MIDLSTFWLFLAGALLLNITPGPDMAFTLATSARGGVKAGVAAAAGVGLGSLVWAGLTAAGLAALLAASEHAFTIIRVVGGSYLIFLAVRTIMAREALYDANGAVGVAAAFRSGAMTNLFNPKVGLFFLAFLPTFANPAIGSVWAQTLTLGAIFSISGACVLMLVALAGGSLRDRLARSRRLRTTLNAIAATAFGALGLRILLTRPE
jgi:threonine/homoserine/homoserine lactone efflux protein